MARSIPVIIAWHGSAIALILSWGVSCHSGRETCADKYYKIYSDKIFSGEHEEAYLWLEKAYKCDTSDMEIAFMYVQSSIENGYYQSAMGGLNHMLNEGSLYPYIWMQIACEKLNDSECSENNNKIIMNGINSIEIDDGSISYAIPKAIILSMLDSSDQAISYLEKCILGFETPYENDLADDLLMHMRSDTFNLELYLFGKDLPPPRSR